MRDGRVELVMIMQNRREEALPAVGRLPELPERPRVVVDSGSARLSALDGPQRTSTARRYAG
jgi:hypothetical protein